MDFACGTGITTIQIAGFVREIHAIDISQRMIDIIKDKVEKNLKTKILLYILMYIQEV